jgi:hypothetical protein
MGLCIMALLSHKTTDMATLMQHSVDPSLDSYLDTVAGLQNVFQAYFWQFLQLNGKHAVHADRYGNKQCCG